MDKSQRVELREVFGGRNLHNPESVRHRAKRASRRGQNRGHWPKFESEARKPHPSLGKRRHREYVKSIVQLHGPAAKQRMVPHFGSDRLQCCIFDGRRDVWRWKLLEHGDVGREAAVETAGLSGPRQDARVSRARQ